MRGRLVNGLGYLIDERGNIVNEKGSIMFNFWELMFQEPPKIFDFTEFDINWIKGTLDRDVTKNPRHDDEYDLEGRLINTLGYLVDVAGNIIDQHGKIVFRKEILTNAYDQDAKIPPVFTMGLLYKPIDSKRQETERMVINGKSSHGQIKRLKEFIIQPTNNQEGIVTNEEITGMVSGDGEPDAFSKSGTQSGFFSLDETLKQVQNSI